MRGNCPTRVQHWKRRWRCPRPGPRPLRPGTGAGAQRRHRECASESQARHRTGAPQPAHRPPGRRLRADASSGPLRFPALSRKEELVGGDGRPPHFMEDTSPLRVVAIGGGTGLSALLAGLKEYALPGEDFAIPIDITAIVTVTDDGGSSGRLRRDFDVLPPGDIRNCMVALSEDSALLSRLFQYRFAAGRGLKGHSFGNLFLMALTHVMGDFPEAVKASCEVLKIAGRIYPATNSNVALEATLEDGSKVIGETRISRSRSRIKSVRLRPGTARPLPETLEAIAEADVITFGPGSLFTSVIPNLLVKGIPEAIRKSPAVKAYFVNLMWQPGETTNFRASDHIRAIHQHARDKLLDYAITNMRPIKSELKKRYARQEALPVENDLDAIFKMGLKVMAGKLASNVDRVRHDSAATAAVVVHLAQEGRRRRMAAGAA